jgi:hypothetical protein
MIWFEASRIPERGWPFMNAVRLCLVAFEGGLEPTIDLTEGNEAITITGCMRAYRQAVIGRVLDLSQAAIGSWNAGFPVGSVVCARALLETIATFHSFLRRAEAAAAAKDWAVIGRLIDAYAFSTSLDHSKRRTDVDPPRVGRMVKEFIRSTQPGIEVFWDQICDIAHPNGQRLMDYAGTLTNQQFVAKSPFQSESNLFVALFNAMHCICWMSAAAQDFEILLTVMRTGESLPPDHPLMIERRQLDDLVHALVKPNKGR